MRMALQEDEPSMRKKSGPWITAAIVGASAVIRGLKKNAVEMAKIQGAMAYLRGVEILRDLLIYQLGILACVIFLVFGVILMQAAMIFCLALEGQARIFAAFGVGLFDFSVALGLIVYFISSKRWLREAAKYNAWVDEFLEERN